MKRDKNSKDSIEAKIICDAALPDRKKRKFNKFIKNIK